MKPAPVIIEEGLCWSTMTYDFDVRDNHIDNFCSPTLQNDIFVSFTTFVSETRWYMTCLIMQLWRQNYTISAKIRFKNALYKNSSIFDTKNGKVLLFVLYESIDMVLLISIDFNAWFWFPDRENLVKIGKKSGKSLISYHENAHYIQISW